MSVPPEILERIKDRYDELFNKLGPNQELTGPWQALFWEQYGFETIRTIFKNEGIPFEAGPEDIRPFVLTTEGKEVEIDFRAKVKTIPVYFGVTAFYRGDRDASIDLIKVDEPITDLEEKIFSGDRLVETVHHDSGQIVGRIKQADYLNRKLVYRVAKEGRNYFNTDYIYIVFPNQDPSLGGDVDGIPDGFQFESESKYTYRETAITGLVLIGKYVQVDPDGSKSISKTRWVVKTKSFPKCSPMMKEILKKLDGVRLDHTKRLKSLRAFLEENQADPMSRQFLKSLLEKYGDVL